MVLAFPREGDLEREGSSPSAIGKGCESSVQSVMFVGDQKLRIPATEPLSR